MFLSKRGSGFYYLFYFDHLGKRHKVSTHCKHKSDALKFLQAFQADKQSNKTSTTLLSNFTEEYLRYSRTVHRPKSTESARTALREFSRIVGDRTLCTIGIREIEQFVAVKQRETSPRTARVYLVTLASAFETAKRWGMTKTNPIRGVEKPRLPEHSPSYLTQEQFRMLIPTIENETLRSICILAAMTGLRLSEITSLRWEDVEFGRRLIHIQNSAEFTTKSKRNRTVPMNHWVNDLLESRGPSDKTGLVFHLGGRRLRKEFVSKGFKRAALGCGLDGSIHFHSLRHTFASWLVQSGVPIYDVQRLLGHSNVSMTQIYSHLQPDQMHETVNRIQLVIN